MPIPTCWVLNSPLRKTILRYMTLFSLMFAAFPVLSAGAEQEEIGLVEIKIMNLTAALILAQTALEQCRSEGYQVAVAVVDRFGVPQILLRDRFAGPHTPKTATLKAQTAVSFRIPTAEMVEITAPNHPAYGVRQIPGVLILGGGMPITAQGGIIGGVGVSGAPGGAADQACAQAGIEAVQADLEF